MHGYRIARHGGPEVLQWRELPDPAPGPDEVLVRVRACGLNHLDLWVRNGVEGHEFPLPLVPGAEVAGTVEALGAGVADVEPGSPVVLGAGVSCGHCPRCLAGQDWLCRRYGLLGEHRDGGAAELVAVPRRNLFPIPRGLTYLEAAAIPLVFLTAWHMLAARAELRAHEDVLLHAAGSGVTTAGIQIAKLLGARRILVTSSSSEKLARALALGATHAFDVTKVDFPKAVREATGGKGADVVFDHVGGETLERSFECLARGGRIVLCGATSAPTAEIPLRAVFFKSLSILGSTMGSLAELAHLLPWFESGELVPVVAETFPLERLADAHARLESRAVFGKIVLAVAEGAAEVARRKEA
ncbi:MAG TPA: zinc-binding dehydrogenase [Thermoanaerobaculia bacterium]|nr:zinc-binding dehydrogenase [Thermoanaerobaculia bacterium]